MISLFQMLVDKITNCSKTGTNRRITFRHVETSYRQLLSCRRGLFLGLVHYIDDKQNERAIERRRNLHHKNEKIT